MKRNNPAEPEKRKTMLVILVLVLVLVDLIPYMELTVE